MDLTYNKYDNGQGRLQAPYAQQVSENRYNNNNYFIVGINLIVHYS